MLCMSLIIIHVLRQAASKLQTALLIRPAESCSMSFPMRLLIQKIFWDSDEGFKIASCIAHRHNSTRVFVFDGYCTFSVFADHLREDIVEKHVLCVHCSELCVQIRIQ